MFHDNTLGGKIMEFLINKVLAFSEVINAVKSNDAKEEIAVALIEEIINATTPPKEEQQPIFGSYYPAPYPIPNLNYNFPMGNTIKLPTSFGDSSITKSQQPSSEPKKKSKSNKK